MNLKSLSQKKFEEVCLKILKHSGFTELKIDKYLEKNKTYISGDYPLEVLGSLLKPQKWYIQCIKDTTTEKTIKELREVMQTLPDPTYTHCLFIVNNRISDKLRNWIATQECKFAQQIHVLDETWIHTEFSANPNLFKPLHVNYTIDGKYNIDFALQIYTAGKMNRNLGQYDIAQWRLSIEEALASLGKQIDFLHPEFSGCDHSGILVNQTVTKDSSLIQSSDLMIAYLQTNDQFGTICEIMLACHFNIPIAVFIDESIQIPIQAQLAVGDIDNKKDNLECNNKTDLFCPCNLNETMIPEHCNEYWFLIELLRQKRPNTYLKITTKDKLADDVKNYIQEL